MELVSISAFAFKDRPLKNGEHSLKIRTTFKDSGKWIIKYDSLGVSVKPEFWNFTKNTPTKTHPEKKELENKIARAVSKKRLELITVKPVFDMPVRMVMDITGTDSRISVEDTRPIPDPIIKPEPAQKTVFGMYGDILDEMQRERCGSARCYRYSLNTVSKFTGNRDLTFTDIDFAWLNRFEQWMNKRGVKDTTKSNITRTLRAVFNKAIKLKYVPKDAYPFNEWKISKFDCSTEKRAIEKEDIKKIMDVQLDAKNTGQNIARDLFVFSYLSGGINFVDMAHLTRDNITDEEIIYKRKKTGVKVKCPLSLETTQILNKYGKGKTEGYIFPIFDRKIHKTPQQQEDRRHKMLRKVNQKIREVAEIAGLDKHLTTYVARHTFATALFKSNTNIGLISESLGHKNLETTQIYLGSFNTEEKREAFKNLL